MESSNSRKNLVSSYNFIFHASHLLSFDISYGDASFVWLLVIYSCIDLASPGSTTVLFSSVGAEGSLHADSCVFIALG